MDDDTDIIIGLSKKVHLLEKELATQKRLNALQNQDDILAELRTITGARFGQDIRLVLKCLLETRENWRTTLIGLLEPWHGQHIDSRTRERIEKALGGYRHTSGIRKAK
jgi:hypothetical protein